LRSLPVLVAPLLLAACAGSWPAQSYVSMPADSDAVVLAPALSDCIAEIVPPRSAIALPAQTQDEGAAMNAVLTDDLRRNSLTERPDGIVLTYVVAPIGRDAFIRVTASQRSCAQYFYRASDNALHVGGPQMVLR